MLSFDQKLHFNPALVPKSVGLPKALGNHEDVAKEYRGVEVEAANGLQGHLCRKFRRLNQFQKRVFLLERAVFRQCPPSLAHQPNRGPIHQPATARSQKTIAVGPTHVRSWAGGWSGFADGTTAG